MGGVGASFDPERIERLRRQLDSPGSRSPNPIRPAGDPARPGNPVKLLWQRAIVIILGFTGLLYGVEAVDQVTGDRLDYEGGVEPREIDGLDGILFAPVLHANWEHLIGNTLPVLVLGLLTLLTGIGRGLAATAIIWVIAGTGVWLTGATGSVHVGASVLVFGWLTYLLCWGWLARNWVFVAVSVGVGLLYGSILWGVLPGQPGISWQGHLFGAVGGLVAGWVLSAHERRHRRGANAGRPVTSG
ncbi:rhomboid family intramembrane serine protease [Nocardia yamanashiensis]|uniref:rhomboid family intramembrane serine protease n=1 Tax=Nocardia yamanashiensis TaxID=209247 RepID=UPI000A00E279|nr:rhomboid family intramembrane serine protease [Nocardia yamanashiensis]